MAEHYGAPPFCQRGREDQGTTQEQAVLFIEMASPAAAPPDLAKLLIHPIEERPLAESAQRIGFLEGNDRLAKKALPTGTYEFIEWRTCLAPRKSGPLILRSSVL